MAATTTQLLALAHDSADAARAAWVILDAEADHYDSPPSVARQAERMWAEYMIRLKAVKALHIREMAEHAAAHN